MILRIVRGALRWRRRHLPSISKVRRWSGELMPSLSLRRCWGHASANDRRRTSDLGIMRVDRIRVYLEWLILWLVRIYRSWRFSSLLTMLHRLTPTVVPPLLNPSSWLLIVKASSGIRCAEHIRRHHWRVRRRSLCHKFVVLPIKKLLSSFTRGHLLPILRSLWVTMSSLPSRIILPVARRIIPFRMSTWLRLRKRI